jgi:TrmH family RNA methyltransferase
MAAVDLLGNVSIILVHTKTPSNIGAVARAMMNMGLSRLILVRPPRDPDGAAEKLAAGAEAVIRNAARFETLREAVADQHLVIGTSRQKGRLRKNICSPREMAEQVVPLLGKNSLAFVFGREVNGLDRADLALCHEVVAIPSHEQFPSLNLSHAVMIMAYELFIAVRLTAPDILPSLATAAELEGFFGHLQGLLQDSGFLDREHPDRIMLSLRQLFGRARLEPRDVSILRGILTQLRKHSPSDKP